MTTVRRAGADSDEKSIRKDRKHAEISREALALLLQPFNNQDHGGNNPRINVSYDSQVVKMLIFKDMGHKPVLQGKSLMKHYSAHICRRQ